METFGDLSDLRLSDLRALCAVLDHGNFTQAARMIGETKGSVSRRITRLEQQLGVQLLQRTSRVVSPTEAGTAFHLRVMQSLSLLDEGITELRDAHLEPSGLLRVTMPVDLGLYVFAPLIAEFCAQYPQIQVDVVMTEAFLDLATHQLDGAIRATSALTDSQYILNHLANLSLQLYAAPAYLNQRGYPESLEDLANHWLLLHRTQQQGKVLVWCDGHSSHRHLVKGHITANDFALLKQTAIAGAGIAILPSLICEADCQSGQLMQVLPQWYLETQSGLYLLHEAGRLLPARVNCFRDFLRQQFSQNPALRTDAFRN
jgi:DNA-binding transcriptional LysR family regulator